MKTTIRDFDYYELCKNGEIAFSRDTYAETRDPDNCTEYIDVHPGGIWRDDVISLDIRNIEKTYNVTRNLAKLIKSIAKNYNGALKTEEAMNAYLN